LPDTALTFTTAYSDADGWANLKEAYLLISTGTSALANSAYLYYNQNTNKLYLRDDANSSWLGGFAPGSSNTIENSQVKLNCSATTVLGSASTMSINWNITFKPAYSGKTYNTYLKVKDDAGSATAWAKKGTYTINQAPQLGTITPSSGTGWTNAPQTFTTTYIDPDGWQKIKLVYFLMNTSTVKTNCLYAYYNQNTNKLYLRDNANSAWLGGYAPGSSNIIENSYAKLDCSATTVSGTDSTLTVNWAVTLKPTFIGLKNTYLYVKDDANAYVNYTKKGTWNIQSDSTPPVISIDPVTSPTNQDVILSYTVSDDFTSANEIIVTGDNSPYTVEGTYDVTLTAKDKAGNISNKSISFTIDKTAPVVIITSPQDGAVVEDSQAQLQGTVDSVPFSEIRTLIEGENVLTKTATDAAGNSSSTSITVYLYLGQTIGSEGGEVLSADGKVKVVIPQGALNEPQQLKVLTVDKETLESAAPGGTSLLSVVECKPYGLIFNKPVEIIYTLYQAEIPGTPVELGFYDGVQKKIIPTGQTSTVPADGYTLSFSIMHFSTYAALKNLTPQGTPIGSGVKIPLPDMFTGAFSHAIPITVLPGRKGIQPALALTYRSSNTNSWVGLGFSLNPGYIVRSTKLGPPTYNDTQDTFYFVTDAGTTELVNLIDNLYQAKIESSFTKFYKEPDESWRVVGKDGSILRFGQATNSKETSSKGTFSWYLTKAIDTNGNYIEYHYTKDSGKSYLSRIDYTGNEIGVSPTNSVEFFLEPRGDISSSYISTAKIATAKRLKEIQVKQNYDLVWRYVLEYEYSQDTNRSLLRTITQYGSDGKSLPQQNFTYQKAK
jgi:hypothetical protein